MAGESGVPETNQTQDRDLSGGDHANPVHLISSSRDPPCHSDSVACPVRPRVPRPAPGPCLAFALPPLLAMGEPLDRLWEIRLDL